MEAAFGGLSIRTKPGGPGCVAYMSLVSGEARLDVDDFMTGLFAALRLDGYSTISLRTDRLYKAMEVVYGRLETLAKQEGVTLGFEVMLDPIHHRSEVIRDAISFAAKRKIISLDNPEYLDIRLMLTRKAAEKKLERMPLNQEAFADLADVFVQNFATA